jgi:hypothetical protein
MVVIGGLQLGCTAFSGANLALLLCQGKARDNLMSVFSKKPLQKKKHFGGTTLFLPIRYRNWPSVFSSRAQRPPPKKPSIAKVAV